MEHLSLSRNNGKLQMNTELNLVTAEITCLREALHKNRHNKSKAELEPLQCALLLSQSKLLALDIERPTTALDCGISIAYH